MIVGYQYRINGGSPVNAGSDLAELIAGLSQTSYAFQVRAFNDAGKYSGWSTIVNRAPLPPGPAAPTGLRLTVIDDSSILAEWDPPADTTPPSVPVMTAPTGVTDTEI